MDTNTRQIALSVLGNLREDVAYARLNNGSRVLDVADLRQYIYEQMSRIRTAGLAMDGLYDNGHGQDILKGNGHNGEAHLDKNWHEREQHWVRPFMRWVVVVTGKLEEFDEPYRSEKPLWDGKTQYPW